MKYTLLNGFITSIDIYIPVWIDLKEILYIDDFFKTRIYIPVWIDLKHYDSIKKLKSEINLHSSMDRFEADDVGCSEP